KGISLDLRPGEVLGLMGPSLSGKSTLCRVLAGVAPRATGGEMVGVIELGGRAVDIGYVADNPAALMTRTRAIKEVESSLDHLGLTHSQSEKRALDTLAELGIAEDEAQKYIWELPIHRQLLVALAAAVAERPHLLILDEVGAVLDASGLALLNKTISKITGRGGAVLLVDNSAYRQRELSDRLAIMADGRLTAIGPIQAVLSEYSALPDRKSSAAAAGPVPGTPDDPFLTIHGLSFTYDEGPQVWEDLDLTLARGEVLGIAGRNAAGKTTLAKLLGGLITPQSGEITFDGKPIEPGGDPKGIAVVMHTPSAFFSEPSVEAEIAFALRGTEETGPSIDARVEELAEQFGIAPLLERDPSMLPAGSARLAQIAAMLARDAPVLVLDEAALGMDPTERARLIDAVRRYVARGGSVIALDHNLDLLAALANRIVLIDDKRLRDAGHPRRAFAEDRWSNLEALDLSPPHREAYTIIGDAR
ncbi:MAG: ATP-binding cassette domain-containing protein, partial [Pseudomonadota bacterium]